VLPHQVCDADDYEQRHSAGALETFLSLHRLAYVTQLRDRLAAYQTL